MSDILMPQLGESVTEGTITRWFKQVGDSVQEDEPLFEVSTDKVDTEVPAPESGTLSKIVIEEGETVDVGTVLAVIGGAEDSTESTEAEAPATGGASEEPEPQESAPQEPAAQQPQPQAQQPQAQQSQEQQAQQPPQYGAPSQQRQGEQAQAQQMDAAQQAQTAQPSAATEGRLLSPLVRKLVEDNQIDLSTVQGTGVGGRITREDVLDAIDAGNVGEGSGQSFPAAAPANTWGSQAPQTSASAAASSPTQMPSSQPAAPAQGSTPARRAKSPSVAPLVPGSGDRVESLNKIRMLTGNAMAASKNQAPHAITIMEVDYEAVEKVRRAIRDSFKEEEGFSLTYLPFISRAVVDALHEFPHMNASMGDGSVVLHDEVNLSIAVDLDYEGLLAPVIRSAHDKRLRAIARDIQDLARRARSKNLSPDDLSGGTFTLTNSGSYGTSIVIPIINQPQVAILSTDGISRRPVVVTDEFGGESIGIHSVGNLTLSWDHRAFDGAYAAAFMSRVKEILETREWAAEL